MSSSAFFNRRVEDTVKTILQLNVIYDFQKEWFSFSRSKNTYRIVQNVSPLKQRVLREFLHSKSEYSGCITDSSFPGFLEKHAKREMRKEKIRRIFLWGSSYGIELKSLLLFMALFVLQLMYFTNYRSAPLYCRIGVVLLLIGAIVLASFNKIRLPEVEKHLAGDKLTLEDCEKVFDRLNRKKFFRALIYLLCAAMVAVALFVLPRIGVSTDI